MVEKAACTKLVDRFEHIDVLCGRKCSSSNVLINRREWMWWQHCKFHRILLKSSKNPSTISITGIIIEQVSFLCISQTPWHSNTNCSITGSSSGSIGEKGSGAFSDRMGTNFIWRQPMNSHGNPHLWRSYTAMEGLMEASSLISTKE